jgi:hypothetical protein
VYVVVVAVVAVVVVVGGGGGRRRRRSGSGSGSGGGGGASAAAAAALFLPPRPATFFYLHLLLLLNFMLQIQMARRGVQRAVGRGPYAGDDASSLLYCAFTYSNLELQGLGVLMMSDGSRYIGEFHSDKFCGLGRLESSNGDSHVDSFIFNQ